jgi:hypothetical protein
MKLPFVSSSFVGFKLKQLEERVDPVWQYSMLWE